MRTTKQWLAERELGLEAAKVLVPGPWKHKWNGSGAICCDCLNCGVPQRSGTRKEDCPVPDRIDVKDWNVVMEWGDKIFNGEHDEILAMVKEAETGSKEWDIADVLRWWLRFAQPRHYIVVACMAKEI